jgi:tRNA-specific 2-thiouridylase
VHCNGDLKFATLAQRAAGLGAAFVATGHYARVERDDGGIYLLKRGLDPAKDQSYFLFTLTHLERHGAAPAAGAIRDVSGTVLGTHDGVHRFTVGQRKGLGLSAGVRLYVVDIDAGNGAVTVGPRESLERIELTASGVNWVAGTPPARSTRVTAQIRYRHREAAASITPLPGSRVHARFDEPQYAVAPGQAVVFYDHDIVIGGGWIEREQGAVRGS